MARLTREGSRSGILRRRVVMASRDVSLILNVEPGAQSFGSDSLAARRRCSEDIRRHPRCLPADDAAARYDTTRHDVIQD